MAVHEIRHPLVRHKLGKLRQDDISVSQFRALSNELCQLLTYELTKDLEMEKTIVKGWAGPVEVEQIKGKMITAVPILRAGLGMLDGFLDMIPGAKVSVVGMFRDETSLEPVKYYAKLATNIATRHAVILDPMLATGGTLNATISLLKDAGCRRIRALSLVAAPEGVNAVTALHPDVDIYVASVDCCLNENGYILPGLGDAGDKIFGTR